MDHKPTNVKIISELIESANESIRNRSLLNIMHEHSTIFVGFNVVLQRHVIAMDPGNGAPAMIKLMGAEGIQTREELINCAFTLLDTINGKLIVYPEPGYEKPHNSDI